MFIERLVSHPRLPLAAGRHADRPTIKIWECGEGEPRELAVIGGAVAAYREEIWERGEQIPSLAWHPFEPRLFVTDPTGLGQWTPAGLSTMVETAYRFVAVSEDGRTAWAFPATGTDGKSTWNSADALDLATGTRQPMPAWDTGMAEHPGGGLVATLQSDQGATLVLFARVDQRLHVLRRALIPEADGYETPRFSPDGRFLAIRGNAYGESLQVFAFPSLRRVLATSLTGQRHRDAIVFDRSGALLVGTPRGTVVAVDLDDEQAVEHDVLPGESITAIAVLATGEVLIAGGGGSLGMLPAFGPRKAGSSPAETAAAFIAETDELPDDADLEESLNLTDGTRSWEPDDLASITEAANDDPAWLQIQAFMNAARK